jgi:hypothetical protein
MATLHGVPYHAASSLLGVCAGVQRCRGVHLIQPSIHPALLAALAALAATLNVYRAVSAKRQKGHQKLRLQCAFRRRSIIPRFSAHTAEQRRRLLAAVIIDATPATWTEYGILCKQIRNTTNPAMAKFKCFALALFTQPQKHYVQLPASDYLLPCSFDSMTTEYLGRISATAISLFYLSRSRNSREW